LKEGGERNALDLPQVELRAVVFRKVMRIEQARGFFPVHLSLGQMAR
jgi:hypothetical protein